MENKISAYTSKVISNKISSKYENIYENFRCNIVNQDQPISSLNYTKTFINIMPDLWSPFGQTNLPSIIAINVM